MLAPPARFWIGCSLTALLAALPASAAAPPNPDPALSGWFQSLSLWVVFYFSLIAIVFFGSLRMRLPVEPLLGLLAAAGFEDARRSLRGRARGLRVIEGKRGSGA